MTDPTPQQPGRPGAPQHIIPAPPPPGPDRALMVSPVAPEIRALSESKLITPEQGRALTSATASLSQMTTAMTMTGGKAPGERHFNRIDTLREMRLPSPIGEARNILHSMAASWGSLSKDFHTYRQLFYEARLRRAKLNKKMHAAVDAAKNQDDDDIAIHEAEIQLEAAEIDALEARVAKGHAELTAAISVITRKGEQYAALVTANGGREFSESDFREEEITYHLTSAWWVAAESFDQVDERDQFRRAEELDEINADPRANNRTKHWRARMQEQKNSRIEITHEIILYFRGLGISEDDVRRELKALADQRFNYTLAIRPGRDGNAQREDFSAHFESWVKRTVAMYIERVRVQVAQPGGFEKLAKIMSIIDPPVDKGDQLGDVGQIKRRSITS
jgi:hypothetical protein